MLQSIRDKISGWFAALFLGAIAVVFIFWGIQFESTVTASAAEVNGEKIPVETVRRAWQDRQNELQQALRNELPPELVKSEQARLVDGFITRELLVQRAQESGYRVSDRELAETLYKIPELQVDGKFSRDRYAAALRQQGRSEAEFEREFRRDLQTGQLRNGIAVSSFVTPAEMKRRLELLGEVREVSYAVVPASAFAAQATVKPETIPAYYDKHKSEFMTTESVSLQYLKLDLADIAGSLSVTDEALRKFYDENADRYSAPERRRASHVLVESGSDDAAAKKKAEGLLARVRAGEDFAKLARENSDDPGSKDAGGDLGWSTREAYVKEFSDALFTMKQGEVVGPVRTQFGYHLIRLDGIEAPHVRSFDEVRAELEAEYRRDQAQSLFYDKSQQLADESFASLSELDTVAKKLGMTVQTVENFTRQGGGPFGAEPKVIEAAFSNTVLQDRQNSPPVALGDDSVVVLRVADHRPAQQRPLEAVRPEIEASMKQQAEREAAAAAAQSLAARVNAGEPLASVAASANVQATAPQPLTREGTPAAITGTPEPATAPVAPELIKAVFQAPRPAAAGKASAGTVTLASGDQAVFAISAVRPGNVSLPPEELAQGTQRAAGSEAASEFASYLAELQRTAKIKRNDNLFVEQ